MGRVGVAMISYLPLASFEGPERQRALSALHDSGLGQVRLETLNGFVDDLFRVSHPVVKAPLDVGLGALRHPVGYVELDLSVDAYAVIRVGFETRTKRDASKFQLLIVPDVGRKAVTYTRVSDIDGFEGKVNLEIYNSPDQQVSAPVSVESSQLMNPPQSTAGVAPGRVVGLCGFNAKAHPLGKPLQLRLGGEVLGRDKERVSEPASIWRRVLPGFIHHQLVEEAIEGRAEVVEPLAEDDGSFDWEWCGRLELNNYSVVVLLDRLRNRMGLQVFGLNAPHFIAVRAGSLNTGIQQPEFIIHTSKPIDADTTSPAENERT